jgi:hypothetical protein
MTKTVKAGSVTLPQQARQQEQIRQIRNEIGKRFAERNIHAAAELYLQLMQIDDKQIPPKQYLLDIANQLAGETRHTEAAQAYEKFLTHYSVYESVEQVELMLGIIYSRYLDKPDLAVKYLQAAADKLTDPGQIRLCREELAKING